MNYEFSDPTNYDSTNWLQFKWLFHVGLDDYIFLHKYNVQLDIKLLQAGCWITGHGTGL